MLKIRLSATAEQDLQNIQDYTLATWGSEQAEKYLALIEQALLRLLDNPEIGPNRPDIKTGYRCISVEKHLIFYQISELFIDVLAIPHGRMDVKNHFIDSEK